jgi:DNA helicase-2/ATP-dependent DNA helicase PcrA
LISGSGTNTEALLLDTLNPVQREAVLKTDGPVLILAGAGSGKTRVLTHRIAWIVRGLGASPGDILAFTFTNKAAGEMKERVAHLLGGGVPSMWIGTFHSTCVRILRASGSHRGLDRNFVIYDSDDQETLVRRLLTEQNLGDKEFRPRAVLSKISNIKNRLLSPEEYRKMAGTYHEELVAKIYAAYHAALKKAHALDFDDLIGETVLLLAENERVRASYAERFRYVHVDEYQDTNGPQYELIRHLASAHRNLCVVGDDDQSIYGWRGADIGNILSFEKTYPDAWVVRLEQNYRSTGNILAAANAVVKNNRKRKEKTLWTEEAAGDLLQFTLVSDEEAEGEHIVERMTNAVHKDGRSLKDLAVLYRTNAQSRAIENALRRAAVPYELIGGTPFYQRREVKDLLAYLRLSVNEADDIAFRRVLNVPKRGIGKTTLDRLAALAFRLGVPLLAAARRVREEVDITASTREKILAFVDLIEGLQRRGAEPVSELLTGLVAGLDYGNYLREDDPETAADRIENVEELIVGARQYVERATDASVAAFLNEVALLTDADRIDDNVEKVRLMTAHNAKGLEFDVVFLAGLEEGLMPHASSAMDPEQLEEERRLFYVALTRARKRVQLSAATNRRRFGVGGPTGLSRFLNELPRELLNIDERASMWGSGGFSASGGPGDTRYVVDEDTSWRERRPGGRPASPAPPRAPSGTVRGGGAWTGSFDKPVGPPSAKSEQLFSPGPRHVLGKILHPTFGRGEVVAQEGKGPDARLTVLFPGGVVKKIVARYAQWEESDVDF